jgi:hypothetical protein
MPTPSKPHKLNVWVEKLSRTPYEKLELPLQLLGGLAIFASIVLYVFILESSIPGDPSARSLGSLLWEVRMSRH